MAPADATESLFELRARVAEVYSSRADVARWRERAEEELGALRQQEATLEGMAGEARRAGREDLASEARSRWLELQEQRSELAAQVQRLQADEEELAAAEQRLLAKIGTLGGTPGPVPTPAMPGSDAPVGERNSRNIPQDVKVAVAARDRGRCRQCGSAQDLHFDHVIPWSKGGVNTINNIQLLCGPCNRRKGDDDIPANL
jgi:hypothetical protein